MCAVLYMLLATGMFFFQDTYFSIGGMELSLKNPCALAILFLALLNLTVTVRLDRLLILSRHTAVQMLPCLVPLVFSSVVWVGTQAESDAVLNGVTMVIPQLLAVLEAAAALYLFGARGIWYCLGAMCAANLAGVLAVIYEGGGGRFPKGVLHPADYIQQGDRPLDGAAGNPRFDLCLRSLSHLSAAPLEEVPPSRPVAGPVGHLLPDWPEADRHPRCGPAVRQRDPLL